MAHLWEYAELSNDVYFSAANQAEQHNFYQPASNKLKAWVSLPALNAPIADLPPHPYRDFFARLYANRFTHETIISYRGTIPSKWNFYDDLTILTRHKSNAVQQAIQFYLWAKHFLHKNKFYRNPPKLTGHSLGGFLAETVLEQFPETYAVIFNSPKLKLKINYQPNYQANYVYFDLEELLFANSELLHGEKNIFIKQMCTNFPKTHHYIQAITLTLNPLLKNRIINIDVDRDLVHRINYINGKSFILTAPLHIDVANLPIAFFNKSKFLRTQYGYHQIATEINLIEKNPSISELEF